MTRQKDFMDLVIDTLERQSDLKISTNELKDGGLYAEFDAGMNVSQYYSKNAVRSWPITFMAKNIDQETCIDSLCYIAEYLQKLKVYPQHIGYVWLNAEVTSYPAKVGRQEDGQYIYACTVDMQVYF